MSGRPIENGKLATLASVGKGLRVARGVVEVREPDPREIVQDGMMQAGSSSLQ